MAERKETKVFEFPGAVVRVRIQDLTPEEREQRMQRIHIAAEELLKARKK